MNLRTLALAFLLPVMASAQQFGTKASPTGSNLPTQSAGTLPFFQLLVALLLVGAALKWGIPFVAKKWATNSGQGTGGIQIKETAPLNGGQLHVIQVRGRTLLIGVTAGGIRLVADLSETPEPKLFAEIVQEEVQRPHVAPYAIVNDSPPSAAKAEAALDRLERLLG